MLVGKKHGGDVPMKKKKQKNKIKIKIKRATRSLTMMDGVGGYRYTCRV